MKTKRADLSYLFNKVSVTLLINMMIIDVSPYHFEFKRYREPTEFTDKSSLH